jgi:hypothetical protein
VRLEQPSAGLGYHSVPNQRRPRVCDGHMMPAAVGEQPGETKNGDEGEVAHHARLTCGHAQGSVWSAALSTYGVMHTVGYTWMRAVRFPLYALARWAPSRMQGRAHAWVQPHYQPLLQGLASWRSGALAGCSRRRPRACIIGARAVRRTGAAFAPG